MLRCSVGGRSVVYKAISCESPFSSSAHRNSVGLLLTVVSMVQPGYLDWEGHVSHDTSWQRAHQGSAMEGFEGILVC